MARLGPQPELLEGVRGGARYLGCVGKELLEEITPVHVAAQAVTEPDRGATDDKLLVSVAQAGIARDAHLEGTSCALAGAVREEGPERRVILCDDEAHRHAIVGKNGAEGDERARCRAVDGSRNGEDGGPTCVRSRIRESLDAIGRECRQALLACFQEVVVISGGHLDLHVTSFWNLMTEPPDTVRSSRARPSISSRGG
jgi:hypothetical protein